MLLTFSDTFALLRRSLSVAFRTPRLWAFHLPLLLVGSAGAFVVSYAGSPGATLMPPTPRGAGTLAAAAALGGMLAWLLVALASLAHAALDGKPTSVRKALKTAWAYSVPALKLGAIAGAGLVVVGAAEKALDGRVGMAGAIARWALLGIVYLAVPMLALGEPTSGGAVERAVETFFASRWQRAVGAGLLSLLFYFIAALGYLGVAAVSVVIGLWVRGTDYLWLADAPTVLWGALCAGLWLTLDQTFNAALCLTLQTGRLPRAKTGAMAAFERRGKE